MTQTNEFAVWIGCLACYNAGRLVGDWYAANEAGEIGTQALHAAHNITTDASGNIIGDEIYGPHEELWVMDLDNAPEGYHREMSPSEAQVLAEAIEEIESTLGDGEDTEAYLAWVADHYGQPPAKDLADYLGDFVDYFVGVYDEFQDYADEIADMNLGLEGASYPMQGDRWNELMREVGPVVEFAIQYFDYAGHARDLEMDCSTYRLSDGRVAVFSG